MKVSFTTEGGSDLTKRLQELPRAVSVKAQRDALMAGAEPMRSEMAIRAPRSDGPGPHMADHIVAVPVAAGRLETVSTGHDAAVEIGPERRFFYGYFAEYGTVKQSATPFARPAFDNQAQTSLGVITGKLWDAIRRALPQSFGGRSATGRNL